METEIVIKKPPNINNSEGGKFFVCVCEGGEVEKDSFYYLPGKGKHTLLLPQKTVSLTGFKHR